MLKSDATNHAWGAANHFTQPLIVLFNISLTKNSEHVKTSDTKDPHTFLTFLLQTMGKC